MTGEITLRGRVLPIGGLKEKLLAALRGGIKTVIIPEENVKDLSEIPAEIKNKIDIVPVARVDDVLKTALVRTPERLVWDEAAEAAAVKSEDGATRRVLPSGSKIRLWLCRYNRGDWRDIMPT